MLFRLFIDEASHNYTYLLASAAGREALLIDPVKQQVPLYLQFIRELDLKLVRAIDTHTHADHVTGLGALREQTDCVTLMGERSKAACVSDHVVDNQLLNVDGLTLQALYTPGHTDESFSFVLNPYKPKAVFTGDALLIRGSGRTDFQNGNAGDSWDSIQRLLALPEHTLVYPGHDYHGRTASSIAEEARFNPRVAGKTREQYINIMNNLNLADPTMMDVAVPANLKCGME